jgi:hypothetical protein
MATDPQADFAAALIERSGAPPQGVRSWTGVPPIKRFEVYRNNVRASLTRALAIRFPVAEKIVGTDFFAAMAREYILLNPPRSPILLHYGAEFADFAGSFPQAQSVPYLCDVMRLENACLRAYHAADVPLLDPATLTNLGADQLTNLQFDFHPAFAVVQSPHPILTIWTMNDGDGVPGPIEPWSGEDALVVRPDCKVLMHRLPPGGATFLLGLQAGETLGRAAERVIEEVPDFDLSANLKGILTSGAVRGATAADQGGLHR